MKKIAGDKISDEKNRASDDFFDPGIIQSEVMNWMIMSAYPPVNRKTKKRKIKNSDNKLNKKEKVK